MKKFSWFVLATMIATMGTFVACSDNDDDQGNSSTPPIEGNTLMSVKGNLDLPQEVSEIYQECKIVSAESETDLADGNFQIDSYYNNTVQTFLVGDDDNNIYMLNRNPISRGQKVNMSVESTTIAMVTMHPLFASVDREDYASLVTIITASEYYKPFYNEVENCVINKKHLYDDNNNNLIIAFSNLIEDLCGGSEEEGNYDGSLDDVRSSTLNTRAVFKHSQINPEYIKAEIDGKVLSLRTVWSTEKSAGS